MITSVSEIKEIHEKAGGLWFSTKTMLWWRTRICASGQVFGGRFFVTSDKPLYNSDRRWSVRDFDLDEPVSIVTISQHATYSAALSAAKCYTRNRSVNQTTQEV
jgi:hypothetical protein